ncbi:hypothetical protein, variant 2 [Blastomyces gilchristii SLH14081]|uniref:Uncharacterized protein n=1 Tax=Blastomyces gilchristii (strain SLH14081) TaxID=559298 RepID=A0A179UR79_BLAGS|nr:uncharacterized protein BDBG_05453 [Blastomyces gilchristii SLH14081]XP_031578978.1 hypothetical protein, variant 1 [Blastomyces gilchristii SLH14081]XP_031578979.1 hypothetical protein, variant 2 [Blastomyces gilchristii SLH14081]OAT09727.1 hypothetical protein BDBG_05453 [Blastomyces gilchristii SLH14081]OAT09728.1 hypothetical protein, variant 1 [Blastomyces gilchristii SLH14081]OAT09729.1 hypothetical protein, variant 2 [Blastomyces gilchristii SLH14081]
MATRGGANFVRYFFYAGNTISSSQKKTLVALAYATARDQKLAPKAILIRSDMHDTTTVEGKHVKDPKGWHGTFAFKADDQVEREFHVASHGYTNDKEDFVLNEATHTPEKEDKTPRGGRGSGKVVWPAEDLLEEYVDSPIGYSHLPEQN